MGDFSFREESCFFLGAVCGVTILGMFLVAGGLLWSGFLGGNLAVLFLTQWGDPGNRGRPSLPFSPEPFLYSRLVSLFFCCSADEQKVTGWGKEDQGGL